jgi:hypothetical protein
MSVLRLFFEGVDESTRSSHLLTLFVAGADAEVGVAVVASLGK